MLKEFEKAEISTSRLNAAQKEEIDTRWENHKKGKSKSYTINEVRNFIESRIKR